MKKKFCVLQKKVLSFGPNRTVEVRLNSLAELNVWSVTKTHNEHLNQANLIAIERNLAIKLESWIRPSCLGRREKLAN